MVQLQITLFNTENKYKPISTLVKVESINYYKEHAKEVQRQGIIKICQKRYWTNKELKEYNYTICKVRVYNKNNN